MAKKKKSRANKVKPAPRIHPGAIAGRIFLGGCFAELYVAMVSRFYVNGTLNQVVTWSQALPILGAVGTAAVAVGLALCQWKKSARAQLPFQIGLYTALAGAFVAMVSFLAHWNMSTLTLFSVFVPAATMLGILWFLYDRVCSLSLTILALAAAGSWVCYRTYHLSYINTARTLALLYMLAVSVLAYLLAIGELRRFLPMRTGLAPLYGSCFMSVLGMIISVFRPANGYYVVWVLGMAAFGLGVYFTVKQL